MCLRLTCKFRFLVELLYTNTKLFSTTWGPKLGMRQMIASRYTFGYEINMLSSFTVHTKALSFYGVILPSIVNLIGVCGFSILSCILGGQALASAGNGQLSWT